MTDREKVIKGLECCTAELGTNQHRRDFCAVCPYKDKQLGEWYCFHKDELMRDAIALLKAQEPRVMTISRVLNLKESTPVWLEDVDKKDIMGALFMRNYTGTKCVDFAIVRDWEFERVVAEYMDYGVRWRCWTSRPTDAQREAVKWDG